jgi:hypothetical protein
MAASASPGLHVTHPARDHGLPRRHDRARADHLKQVPHPERRGRGKFGDLPGRRPRRGRHEFRKGVPAGTLQWTRVAPFCGCGVKLGARYRSSLPARVRGCNSCHWPHDSNDKQNTCAGVSPPHPQYGSLKCRSALKCGSGCAAWLSEAGAGGEPPPPPVLLPPPLPPPSSPPPPIPPPRRRAAASSVGRAPFGSEASPSSVPSCSCLLEGKNGGGERR